MKILGIHASPRKGGNTDILLSALLESAAGAGADTDEIFTRDLTVTGCVACGGCDDTGACVLKDDMARVYPLLSRAGAVVLSAPVYFYNVPARAKALIDRSQALWAARALEKRAGRDPGYHGRGYLIAVGATRGENLFVGMELTAKYFFDALGLSYEGGLFFRRVEEKGAIREVEGAIGRARELGRKIALQDLPKSE
ncbi:MAG: flavodoxin family protein [Deltaproteobacteria bacterium]|nr:flavodoxin family protein [Deltaproteobacteria bacterium]